LAGKKMIRRIIARMETLVKLEALPNLDHSSSPSSMQHYLGGQHANWASGKPVS
jgi:hypothetical protein